ncbi:MAG TPA: zf-HC2 domain-containing protein [Polyangiaceae bacterium]|jgi:anti-sigma factor RsiW|nr:zf-HC2 domain-containing protein [Polyangiaceae bacterium]
MTPECIELREQMTELSRGALAPKERASLLAHVATCEDCAAALERETLTGELLESLPRRFAPADLAARVRARTAGAAKPLPVKKSRTGLAVVFAAAASVLGVAVAIFLLGPSAPTAQPMVVEAVNDHLRVLYATSPLEVAASDQHQVKPWFTGKVDFAPVLRFGGNDDYPLIGGAVALFVDRKAALFVFKRRLHEITLLTFRADSLPWPRSYNSTLGDVPALVTTRNGFHVILWQADGLGYVLTSDLAEPELRQLGALIVGKSDAHAR